VNCLRRFYVQLSAFPATVRPAVNQTEDVSFITRTPDSTRLSGPTDTRVRERRRYLCDNDLGIDREQFDSNLLTNPLVRARELRTCNPHPDAFFFQVILVGEEYAVT
jgi:hypothetical protein